MTINRKTNKRPYRKITPATLANLKAKTVYTGNATQVIRDEYPEYERPDARAYRIVAKSDNVATTDYIEDALQQMGKDAMQTIGNVIIGSDSKLALKASTYVVDHLRGKAVTRAENKTLTISIESVL